MAHRLEIAPPGARGVIRVAPLGAILLALVVATHPLPWARVPGPRLLPPALLALACLVPLVLADILKGGSRLKVTDARPLLVGPLLLSAGAAAGYLASAPRASVEAGLRYVLLPWIVPLVALSLDRRTVTAARAALLTGLVGLLIFGAYGFLSGRVGDPAEHALGYFGFQYTPATRNSDAMYLLVLLFSVLYHVLGARGWRKAPWALLTGLGASAVALTYSRGIWIGVGLGALATGLLMARHRRRDALHLAAVLLVAGFALAPLAIWRGAGVGLWQRAASAFAAETVPGESRSDRIRLLVAGLEMIGAGPVLGTGPGAFGAALASRRVQLDQGEAYHVENTFLQVWLDAGIAGWLGFAMLWWWLVFRVPEGRPSDEGVRRYASTVGLVVALTAFLVFNVVLDSIAFWVVLGLVASAHIHWVDGAHA